ncbi:MAG TPA: IS110 family transposase [Actinomycetota bacterium]|nr:IS110 family transposase [Actinomycetota bacterium]
MIFVGVDWAERHHDVCLLADDGQLLATARVPDGIEGVARLHQLIADHAEEPAAVVVGIETDRGLLVGALTAAGYQVYGINPLAASRYRERHTSSRAKSDRGDARVLADLVRTDRHHHRPVAGDSAQAEAVKVLARAHQSLIWARQRQVNALRNMLREFYPAALVAFGADLANPEALAVLRAAPTPAGGQALTVAELTERLRRAGRQRNLGRRAGQLHQALASPQLAAPPVVAAAYGQAVTATVKVIGELTTQISALQTDLASAFEIHPDAEILRSLPGLGVVLGARVLAEFGDDPTRYPHPTARKSYAGTAPITRASGTRTVVLARLARNKRLADACYLWAFSALTRSPGARAYYDQLRSRGATHHQALRALANRLVGILHGCLRHHSRYSERHAWPQPTPHQQAA